MYAGPRSGSKSPARCASPARWGSKSSERRAALAELAFISLGSNLEPERHLPLAIQRLSQIGKLQGISGVYQNPPIGGRSQPDFLNAAVLLEVELAPEGLRSELRRIENDLGRVRTADKYAPRTIDLDLALYGTRSFSGDGYRIPDPEIAHRAHLAIPLADLAPEFRHPELGEPLAEIAHRLRAGSQLVLRTDLSEQMDQLLAPSRPDGH